MGEHWHRPQDMLPEDGQKVWIMDSSGHVSAGRVERGRWFIGDMYIYYVPTFWKERRE